MKIGIGILLIACAIATSTARKLTSEEVKKGLWIVNDLRSRHAKAGGVKNMHDLTYDRKLEKWAGEIKCENMFDISESMPYAVVGVPSMDQWASMNTLEKEEESFYGLLKPWSERIGCSIMKSCRLNGKPYEGICLLEPIESSKSRKLTEAEVKQGLWKVNDLRARHAKADNIANMNALKYDKKLEKWAGEIKCEDMFSSSESTPFVIAGIPLIKDWDNMRSIELEKENFFDLLHPWTDRIGCSIMKDCHVDGKSYEGICLVGPKTGELKKGKPGSQCKYFKTSRGLCTEKIYRQR